MAINKDALRSLVDDINQTLDDIGVPEKAKDFVKATLLGKAIESIEEEILNSRNPRFYLIGRSGHGKSSLINALCGREVATTNPTRPESKESVVYEIPFPDRFACWEVVDTRGIFESTGAGKSEKIDVVEYLKKDIEKHKPDIIIHVISSKETRSMSEDVRALDEIKEHLKEKLGYVPPAIMVLTNTDAEKPSREWPFQSEEKWGSILERLKYVADELLSAPYTPINSTTRYLGIELEGNAYSAVIPVVCGWEEQLLWNIETLHELIGEKLPRSALLGYAQASRNKKLLENMARSITKRFATIASGVSLSPFPFSDIAILLPLQITLIAIIAGLSCRRANLETAKEFLAAVGINGAAGVGLRQVAQQFAKLLPGGSAISAGIAYAGTYAIGVSAELYFFRGEVAKPNISLALKQWESGNKK